MDLRDSLRLTFGPHVFKTKRDEPEGLMPHPYYDVDDSHFVVEDEVRRIPVPLLDERSIFIIRGYYT